MWKRRRTWVCLLALLGVALAVYFEPSHCVRGWLWGEAFFEGRPTSYWREELLLWSAVEMPAPWGPGDGPPKTICVLSRQSTWFEERSDRWLNREANRWGEWEGPRILHGEADAIPVLEVLRGDVSPEIRQLIEIGLKRCEETRAAQDAIGSILHVVSEGWAIGACRPVE